LRRKSHCQWLTSLASEAKRRGPITWGQTDLI
jgi:hypothetical protein